MLLNVYFFALCNLTFVLQMTGKWYLLNTASKCSYLMKHGSKVEPTVMTLTGPSDQILSVSTKTRQ